MQYYGLGRKNGSTTAASSSTQSTTDSSATIASNAFTTAVAIERKSPDDAITIGNGVRVGPSGLTTAINDAGRGLFATKRYDVGDYIYDGEVIDWATATQRRLDKLGTHIVSLEPCQSMIDGLNVPAVNGRGGASFINDPKNKDRVNCRLVRIEWLDGVKRTHKLSITDTPTKPQRTRTAMKEADGSFTVMKRCFAVATKVINIPDEIFTSYDNGYWGF